MYLISAYFDQKTTKELGKLIERISIKTGNDFMIRNQVPVHLTLSSFETKEIIRVRERFPEYAKQCTAQEIQIASCGMLLPYVFYAAPVLNAYLQTLMETTYQFVQGMEDTSVSRFYRPYQWMPHITLAKTLDREQMRGAFEVVQQYFVHGKAEIVELGLAKTNPHEDLVRVSLQGKEEKSEYSDIWNEKVF